MSVDQQIERLKVETGATTDSDLARKLGINKSTVSSWRARGQVPAKHFRAKYIYSDQPANPFTVIHVDDRTLSKVSVAVSEYRNRAGQRVLRIRVDDASLSDISEASK